MDQNPNQSAEAPVTPQATPEVPNSAPVNPTPAPTGGNKKNLFVIGGIIAGVVVLAIVGVIVFLMMNTVSKEDYRDAAAQYNKVSSASSKLMSEVSSLSSSLSRSTSTSFDDDLGDAEKALTTLKEENKKLGDMKASRVGEGKELYDKMNAKVDAYTKRAASLFTSVKNIRPAIVTCGDMSNATSNADRVKAIKDCAGALGNIADIPDPDFKGYIASLKEQYDKLAVSFEKLTAITDPYGAQSSEFSKLRTESSEIQRAVSTATREFGDKVNAADDAVNPKKEAQAYADFLNEQQRK